MYTEQAGSQNSYSGIKFEPGAHAALGGFGNEPFADKKARGLINAHQWPPVVASRIYQYQPRIIADPPADVRYFEDKSLLGGSDGSFPGKFREIFKLV